MKKRITSSRQEFEPLGTDPWLGYIKCNRSNPGAFTNVLYCNHIEKIPLINVNSNIMNFTGNATGRGTYIANSIAHWREVLKKLKLSLLFSPHPSPFSFYICAH